MAQINFTLSSEEILQVFTNNRDEVFKFIVERVLNELMKAESEEQLGAGMHERCEGRTDYRNGTRDRGLNTRIGKITLHVPRHRYEPFHTMIFENYTRSEAALISTMMQMVVSGVSTRKVESVVEVLCGTSFSKSTVSSLCKALDEEVENFRMRRLDEMNAPFLMVDATYFKVRENHRIVSKAFMIALAIKSDGRREIVGFNTFDSENNYSWREFFYGLKKRGLSTVKMIVSDSHNAIRSAIADVYPDVAWQRCQVHFMRNIMDSTPPKHKEGLKLKLQSMFTANTLAEAEKIKKTIIEEYEPVAGKAIDILDKGFTDCMTVMELPRNFRKSLRSTNLLERLNRELKRRSDAIQIFPNEASVMRLMGTVTMEINEAIICKNSLFGEKRYAESREGIKEKMGRIAVTQVSLLKPA